MKKLLFSAIALVAFSATTMANTIELSEAKEVVIPATTTDDEAVKRTTCDIIWVYYYNQAVYSHNLGNGSDASWDYADEKAALNGC